MYFPYLQHGIVTIEIILLVRTLYYNIFKKHKLIVMRQPSFFYIFRTNPFHPPTPPTKKKTLDYKLDTLQSFGHTCIHKSFDWY